MHHTTTRRARSIQLLLAAFVLFAALSAFAPGRASADAPTALRGASAAARALETALSLRAAPNSNVFRPAPAAADAGFVSDELLETATELVHNGVRLGEVAGGTFYVHVKPQGLGAVVSIRFRR